MFINPLLKKRLNNYVLDKIAPLTIIKVLLELVCNELGGI